MHIFHKWTKWEQYEWTGTVTYSGVLVPQAQRGIPIPLSETRQRRTCEICGKMQDEMVSK